MNHPCVVAFDPKPFKFYKLTTIEKNESSSARNVVFDPNEIDCSNFTQSDFRIEMNICRKCKDKETESQNKDV